MRTRACMLALACAACQVGNPLVDTFEPDMGILKIRCDPPPRCVRFMLTREPPDHPAEPVSLKPCMKLCGWGEIEQEGCPQETVDTSLPTTAMCKDIEPKVMQEQPDGSELSWNNMDWQDVNLVLRAEQPLRVSWSGGRLQRVYIELHGPIELHMEQLELFEDVRFQAEASPAGDPYIEIADMSGEKFSVGSAEKPLGGSMKLRAMHLKDLDARADSLTIENTLLEEASLRSDSLTLTDVTQRGGMIDAKNARMSVFIVDDVHVTFCGDARLVAGSVVRSNVTSCPESVLRLYNSTIGTSSVDGPLELDDTSLEYVSLGVSEATRVTAYGSRVNNAHACVNTELLAIGLGSSIKCSACSDALNSDDTQPVCAIDESQQNLPGNYCEIWGQLEMPPMCEGDIPTRPDRVR